MNNIAMHRCNEGIEEAQAELKRETEQQLWQEGLLRHIPVVGSLVNYFLPTQKTGIKGRTLNLQMGQVVTSDILINNKNLLIPSTVTDD